MIIASTVATLPQSVGDIVLRLITQCD